MMGVKTRKGCGEEGGEGAEVPAREFAEREGRKGLWKQSCSTGEMLEMRGKVPVLQETTLGLAVRPGRGLRTNAESHPSPTEIRLSPSSVPPKPLLLYESTFISSFFSSSLAFFSSSLLFVNSPLSTPIPAAALLSSIV